MYSVIDNSEILGLTLIGSSPRLIAVYHVLHRLPTPRHPPNALTLFLKHTKIQELYVEYNLQKDSFLFVLTFT